MEMNVQGIRKNDVFGQWTATDDAIMAGPDHGTGTWKITIPVRNNATKKTTTLRFDPDETVECDRTVRADGEDLYDYMKRNGA